MKKDGVKDEIYHENVEETATGISNGGYWRIEALQKNCETERNAKIQAHKQKIIDKTGLKEGNLLDVNKLIDYIYELELRLQDMDERISEIPYREDWYRVGEDGHLATLITLRSVVRIHHPAFSRHRFTNYWQPIKRRCYVEFASSKRCLYNQLGLQKIMQISWIQL